MRYWQRFMISWLVRIFQKKARCENVVSLNRKILGGKTRKNIKCFVRNYKIRLARNKNCKFVGLNLYWSGICFILKISNNSRKLTKYFFCHLILSKILKSSQFIMMAIEISQSESKEANSRITTYYCENSNTTLKESVI